MEPKDLCYEKNRRIPAACFKFFPFGLHPAETVRRLFAALGFRPYGDRQRYAAKPRSIGPCVGIREISPSGIFGRPVRLGFRTFRVAASDSRYRSCRSQRDIGPVDRRLRPVQNNARNTRRYWRRIRFSNTAPTSDGFGIRQRSAASFRSVWSGCVLPTEPQGTVTCRKRITKPMTNGLPIPVSTEKTLLRLVESRLRLSSAHGIPFLEHGRIFLSK